MRESSAASVGNAPRKIIASVPGLMAEKRLRTRTSPAASAGRSSSRTSTHRSATWNRALARTDAASTTGLAERAVDDDIAAQRLVAAVGNRQGGEVVGRAGPVERLDAADQPRHHGNDAMVDEALAQEAADHVGAAFDHQA